MAQQTCCLSVWCYQLPRKFLSIVAPPPPPPCLLLSPGLVDTRSTIYLQEKALQKTQGITVSSVCCSRAKGQAAWSERILDMQLFFLPCLEPWFSVIGAISDSQMSVCNCQITSFESLLVCRQITVCAPRLSLDRQFAIAFLHLSIRQSCLNVPMCPLMSGIGCFELSDWVHLPLKNKIKSVSCIWTGMCEPAGSNPSFN